MSGGVALAIAGWVLLAIWPSVTWHPLVGAGVAALLALGVLARRRLLLWLLLLWIAGKVSIDASEFSQGFVAWPTLLLVVDAAGAALLLSRRSRRWVRRSAATLEQRYAYTAQPVPADAEYVMSWTPTVGEWDRVMRAKLWADRLTQVRWAIAAVVVVVLALAVAGGDAGSVIFLVAFLGWGVGAWDLLLRRRRLRRRNRQVLQPETLHVSAAGIALQSVDLSFNSAWSRWKSCLVLPDFLVLLTNRKERGGDIMPLPRRGLADTDSWDDLVRLVLSHVPPHPRADRVLQRVPF